MNKKLISLIMTASFAAGLSGSVFADEEVHPTVKVNDRVIAFADQEPVISENGDTLIPVRGVLEAMGAQVTWNGEERSVMVKAKDNIVRLLLKLDNPVMTKYTLTSVTTVDSEEKNLTTPPTLMNERTMIPLRVISENLDATVDWSDADKLITIQTKEYKKYIASKTVTEEDGTTTEYNPSESLLKLYIETDKTTAEAGEEITVSLKAANTGLVKDYNKYSGMSAGIIFDKTKLEAVSQKAVVNGTETGSVLGAANPDFLGNSLKYVYIVLPGADDVDTTLADGTIATFTFKVLTDGETSLSLSDRITSIGYDTTFLVGNDESKNYNFDNSEELYIDTAPIIINAK